MLIRLRVVLGPSPRFSLDEGMHHTEGWLRLEGLI